MSKNYYTLKTGHKPTDEWLKRQPYWFDSDLLFSFLIGMVIGLIGLGIYHLFS